MKIEQVNTARVELKRMLEIRDDVEKRLDETLKIWNSWKGKEKSYKLSDVNISGTKESSAVKNSYKSMKYQLDKMLL